MRPVFVIAMRAPLKLASRRGDPSAVVRRGDDTLSLDPDPLQRGRDNGNAEAEALGTRIYRKRQKLLTQYQTRVLGSIIDIVYEIALVTV